MPPQLDHEKLDVYQLELQFVAWSTELTIELVASADAKARRIAEACDHLDRAGLSSLVDRFSSSSQIREDGVSYRIEDEDEDEDDQNTVVNKGPFQ